MKPNLANDDTTAVVASLCRGEMGGGVDGGEGGLQGSYIHFYLVPLLPFD